MSTGYIPCYLINENGKCMHVHGGLDANGSSITIWEKKDNPGFHWHLIPDNKDKGYHLISSVLTEKLLRVEDEKAGNGAKIVQWVDSGISNAFKMMFIDSDKKGLWNIVNKVGGKCLHNHAVKDDNGNPVTLWEETPNNPAFNWSIAPAVKPLEKVFLVNPNGKAISIKGGENKNGAAVVLATKKNTDAFKWFIVPHEMDKGYFRIESAHTGKVLHNHGGSGANGNPMTTWDKTDPGSALKVRFGPTHRMGHYAIFFKDSGKVVSNTGGKTDNDNPITQWEYKPENDAMIWKIEIAPRWHT